MATKNLLRTLVSETEDAHRYKDKVIATTDDAMKYCWWYHKNKNEL